MNARQPRQDEAPPPTTAARLRKWAPLAAILAVMVLGFALGWHRHLTIAEFIRQRAMLQDLVAANLPLALGGFALLYIAVTALSLPGGLILTVAGGFLFGAVLAASVTVFAATAGAVLIFLAARTALADALRRKAGPFLNRLSDGFRRNALSYLLFLRLVPAFPFWLVNIAPALFDVPLRTFVIATFFGIIPGTLAFAFVGAGLDSVIAAQERANPGCADAGTCRIDPSALVTTELLLAMAGLGVIAVLPAMIRKFRGTPA